MTNKEYQYKTYSGRVKPLLNNRITCEGSSKEYTQKNDKTREAGSEDDFKKFNVHKVITNKFIQKRIMNIKYLSLRQQQKY